MNKEEFLDKCVAFSIKINKLRKFLRETQREYNNSDQIQRSGTSIVCTRCYLLALLQ